MKYFVSSNPPDLLANIDGLPGMFRFVMDAIWTNASWCLYHKTYYGRIYRFRNKLECLYLNTRLGWKGLPGTNTLAYYGNRKLRLYKFYDTGPGRLVCSQWRLSGVYSRQAKLIKKTDEWLILSVFNECYVMNDWPLQTHWHTYSPSLPALSAHLPDLAYLP